jgi:hypothetical protein
MHLQDSIVNFIDFFFKCLDERREGVGDVVDKRVGYPVR